MLPRPALTALLLAAGLGLPASADALLENARAASKEGPAYLFDMVFDDGGQRLTLTVDQTRPENDRVVAMTPELSKLSGEVAKRAERLKKETKGNIWCQEFTESIPASAKRVSETASTATYHFTPL
ncbi:MAG: hypothetical protein B7Z22_14185, partial [Hyphomonas sp. 32-62-5]